jgi:hypothetical protein
MFTFTYRSFDYKEERVGPMSLRKYYFVVVQLAIEIYSLPVSTANGIKFRFQFIKMSDRDLKFVYLFCQTETTWIFIKRGLSFSSRAIRKV